MQVLGQCSFYYVLFIFKWQGQFCNFIISGIGCANCLLGPILVLLVTNLCDAPDS